MEESNWELWIVYFAIFYLAMELGGITKELKKMNKTLKKVGASNA